MPQVQERIPLPHTLPSVPSMTPPQQWFGLDPEVLRKDGKSNVFSDQQIGGSSSVLEAFPSHLLKNPLLWKTNLTI